MPYQTAITIKKTIDNIKKRHYILPSIQREFVWRAEQIETLFDSLMRGYPIGTFLFWRVDKTKIKDFQFYEFLKKYHERDNYHNQKVELANEEDIIAVLDGQQRMTSLYLALVGSYTYKRPYMAATNPKAYPERELYLNLLKKAPDEKEMEYDFRFLTKEDVKKPDDEAYWFNCHKILEFDDTKKMYGFLRKEGLMDTSKYSEEQSDFAGETLNSFFNVIHDNGTISYYEEEGEELDKVLQIFIRINSGGTKLSYSDLLLSIATAQWKGKDAREVIHEFVDDINKIGAGFAFNKDLVLKSCLVLSDIGDVKFKVDNFNSNNMKKIEENWEKIAAALRVTVELFSRYGYNGANLIATNTVIPIAYFIYKNNCSSDILRSSRVSDRKLIKEWLARVLLKGTFGGSVDSIYPEMRKLINENLGEFPLEKTIHHYKGKSKSISFNDDEIDILLSLEWGKPKTFCALSLIYPALNHSFIYHQDHIHPKSKFNKRSMKSAGFSEQQIKQFNAEINGIANLQFLEATDNQEKSDKPFKEWLSQAYPKKVSRDHYLERHHIGPEQSLEFQDFLCFIADRKKTLKSLFVSILGVSAEEAGDSQQKQD